MSVRPRVIFYFALEGNKVFKEMFSEASEAEMLKIYFLMKRSTRRRMLQKSRYVRREENSLTQHTRQGDETFFFV